MATVRAGELRTRLLLQEEVRTDDGAGGSSITFRDVCHVWADVKTSNQRALMEAQKLDAKLSHLVRMRWRPGIKSDMRLIHATGSGPAVLRIDSVSDPDDRRIELHALCEELVQ